MSFSKMQMVWAAVLVGGGAAAGYFLKPVPAVEVAQVPEAPVEVKQVLVKDTADTQALARANARITELTAERDALRAQVTTAEAAAKEAEAAVAAITAAQQAPQQEPEAPRLSPAERLEQLKAEDPERYAEVIKRREQFRTQVAQAKENRDNFLGDIDLSLLTPEQQEIHATYTEALARQDELSEAMRIKFEAGEELSDEERAAMFENRRTIRELQEQERVALLNAVGTSMGFTAEESADFTALIEEVYSATQGAGIRRPRGDMPPPPQGGANPPPPMM